MQLSKAFPLAFTDVAAFFAVLLSLSTGTLNARDADLSKYHPPSVGAFTRIAPATLAMLVQLIDRLGQGFRRN